MLYYKYTCCFIFAATIAPGFPAWLWALEPAMKSGPDWITVAGHRSARLLTEHHQYVELVVVFWKKNIL